MRTPASDPPRPRRLDPRRLFRSGAVQPAATDAQLLAGIQQRSPRALEELYERSAAAALHIALVIVQDRARAEAVTVQAYWQLWERATEAPGEHGTAAAYLFATLRVLETAPGPRTTMQSPLRWRDDAAWKLDFSNIDQMSPEEIARRRAEFDQQKEIAKGQRVAAGVQAA